MKRFVANVPIGLVHPALGRAMLLGAAMAMAAVIVRLGLDEVLGPRPAFLLFIPAVVVASAVAGLLPGIFAAVLGATFAFIAMRAWRHSRRVTSRLQVPS